MVTGRFLFLGKGDKQVDLFSGGSVCIHIPADEWNGNCACYAKKEEINSAGILITRCVCVHVEQ